MVGMLSRRIFVGLFLFDTFCSFASLGVMNSDVGNMCRMQIF